MNKVILQGRLTADPNIYDNNTFKSVTFTLAVNRTYKNKNGEYEPDFINCSLMRNTDLFIKACKKGNFVTVIGEWRTGVYTNKNGINIHTNTCLVNEYYLLPRDKNIPNDNEEQLASRTHISNTQTELPVSNKETGIIPQAFDIDMDDEFPW